MSAYENIRRRWVTAFSASAWAGVAGPVTEPARRWSAHRRIDWTANGLIPGASAPAAFRVLPSARWTLPQPTVLVAPEPSPTPILSEELFNTALVREVRRSARFEEPFVLLLVALDGEVSAGLSAIWLAASEGVVAAARETDIVGWIDRRNVLGVILTDIGAAEEPVAREVESRIRQELESRLDRQAMRAVSIRLHFNVRSKGAGPDSLWPEDRVLANVGPAADRPSVHDALKRGLDIFGSAVLLTLLAPLFGVLAALVKLTSPGPVLFRQVRVGQKAKSFTMLKFRSMQANADVAVHKQYVTQFIKTSARASQSTQASVFKLTNDTRVTRIGRILRKTSLDELPQLWNVLRGDMSLVGPRPSLPYEVEQYKSWHCRRVFEAKPGITGLWQVTGRSRTTFDEMVRLDLRYVRERSFWTDVKILLATPRAVIDGKGAC